MYNGSIIAQIGTKQQLFKDRETYPRVVCDYIEDLVSCNFSDIGDESSMGRLRFNGSGNDMVLQLMVNNGHSRLSREDSCIVLVRLDRGGLRSSVYYGVDCSIDFSSNNRIFALDSIDNYVESLKNYCSSWVVSKGEIGVVVLIVDDFKVFERITKDDFFKYSYILCLE